MKLKITGDFIKNQGAIEGVDAEVMASNACGKLIKKNFEAMVVKDICYSTIAIIELENLKKVEKIMLLEGAYHIKVDIVK